MEILFVLGPSFVVVLLWAYYKFIKSYNLRDLLIPFLVSIVVVPLVFQGIALLSVSFQEHDTELWSGRIIYHDHREEWDEWHPPRTETYTTTENGNTVTKTRHIPGYWEHHYAKNYIETSDSGTMYVTQGINGEPLNDNWPNSNEELMLAFPLNHPTASTHSYKNKVQSSYSIFRHQDIDLKDYPDLPEYPKVTGYFMIDQVIGDVPNSTQANLFLMETNSDLNKMIDDPEKPGKKRSWKQVNMIFVNLSGKTIDHGYALQDKWENGNKNDFVVSFSFTNGQFDWVYPFSWSESEDLKVAVRDRLMDMKDVKDFIPVIEETKTMVADMFVRKQFADFDYIQIETHPIARWIQIILGLAYVIFSWITIMAFSPANTNNYPSNRSPSIMRW